MDFPVNINNLEELTAAVRQMDHERNEARGPLLALIENIGHKVDAGFESLNLRMDKQEAAVHELYVDVRGNGHPEKGLLMRANALEHCVDDHLQDVSTDKERAQRERSEKEKTRRDFWLPLLQKIGEYIIVIIVVVGVISLFLAIGWEAYLKDILGAL